MKISKITPNGVFNVTAKSVETKNNTRYYCITQGEMGIGKWQVRIPLSQVEFKWNGNTFDTSGIDFKLIKLDGKFDKAGNQNYLLAKQKFSDNEHLVFFTPNNVTNKYVLEGSGYALFRAVEGPKRAQNTEPILTYVLHIKSPAKLIFSAKKYGEDVMYIVEFEGDKITFNAEFK
jgi:hypothetical protein